MGVNTGTNRSRGGLLVQDNNTTTPEDTVFAYGVREIIVTTGTLTNNGQGTVTITTGGGGGGSGTVTSVATAGTVNGLTLTGGPITTSGTITLGGTLTIDNSDWSGTALSATNGGTGLTTYTTGDIIYASAANTLSKLTIGSAGEVLTVAGGVPTWAAAGGGDTYTLQSAVNGGTGNVEMQLDAATGSDSAVSLVSSIDGGITISQSGGTEITIDNNYLANVLPTIGSGGAGALNDATSGYIVPCDASGVSPADDVTITFVGPNFAGDQYTIIQTGTGAAVNILAPGGATINGQPSVSLTAQYNGVTVIFLDPATAVAIGI